MVAYNKFENFTQDLADGVHDFNTDQVEIYYTAAVPSASLDAVKADLAEIATGNGYTGPVDTTNTRSRTGGVTSVVGVDTTVTAAGGAITSFRYIVLQNTTPASPLDPLIGWWDHGSTITLADGESHTTNFGTEMFTIT